MRIILARHTKTHLNEAGKYSGQLDPGLSPAGIQQAEELARALAGENIVRSFSSDLKRTRQVARIIVASRGVVHSESELLRELDVGAAAGFTRQEVLERYHKFFSSIACYESCWPGSVLVVCHGTALRVFLEGRTVATHEQGGFTVADLDDLIY